MKYNTISTSSLASEGKKSTFTIYADMDISRTQMANTEAEITTIRAELEMVQNALKQQTRRCRQLVAEYTRRLQQKEQQYQSEKMLRDDQLAKILRALIIFEARLKQEQKFISHQLKEKDYTITKQSNEIKRLLTHQYCKNCNQYYSSGSPNLESLDSSSEYVVTDYQSSNFESLDSGSDIYATISEKSYNTEKTETESDSNKNIYTKNRGKDSLGRRTKKLHHRPSIGTYYEALRQRNDNFSPCSNEDNTSNDYDNLDSLPTESITDRISVVSERIESIFNSKKDENVEENDSSSNLTVSECINTVIVNKSPDDDGSKVSKITESIPVFEGDGETNDNWYASASDQEDEEQRDIYRNNPVLECMNQILLQNMNDALNSPPKTPDIERKPNKTKKVKFSDEEEQPQLTVENVQQENANYYETPVQKVPNFYETPQSIYSNDYEQILSKCSETFSSATPSPNKLENMQEKQVNRMGTRKLSIPKSDNHHYVDLDSNKSEGDEGITRKTKISRVPPALPPKPANLVSKYKPQSPTSKSVEIPESEPDYCSISELNLPTSNNKTCFKKISVVAEINPPNSQDVISKIEKANSFKTKYPDNNSDYDPVVVNDNIPPLLVTKRVENLNIQLARQTSIKSEVCSLTPSPKKIEPEIPKLPQVSEILIPDENEEKPEEQRISHDNYVKNNSQILKLKKTRGFDQSRRPIVMGTSVSNLITGFNNQQLISEINKKPERNKLDKRMFSSFENLQNFDKQQNKKETASVEAPTFDNFDLSQNFEEFKLDDCEIEEYNVDIPDIDEEEVKSETKLLLVEEKPANQESTKINSSIRGTVAFRSIDDNVPNLNKESIEMLKRQIKMQKVAGNKTADVEQAANSANLTKRNNEPTYEHFLECTGLSSKSILTPSRLLSNHKSMLKPKDIKLRSKVKANSNLFDRHSTNTIKYWSEPYI